MIEVKEVERLRRHLKAITAKANDAAGLAQIVGLQDEFAEIISRQARQLHDRGYPWSEIAKPLGISKQAAHYRYGAGQPGMLHMKGSQP